MSVFVEVDHPRFRRVQRDIFVKRVVADCMSHPCSLVKEEGREKLDACCQYGVDVDLGEQRGILEHADEIRVILDDEVANAAWFKDQVSQDPDFPSGAFVRTQTHNDGCLFLSHDGRGCAIHRASLENGWDFHGIKPHVCRLFPLSYDSDSIVLSDDYSDYSCAYRPDAPTVYQVGRPDLEAIFGNALIVALDAAEKHVQSVSLPLLEDASASRTQEGY